MLKSVFTVAAFAAVLASGAARADHPQQATPRDLQELQYDLANLDESLRNVDTRDARYQDLQQRVDWLRRDVERLGQQIQAHRRDSQEGLGANQDEVTKLRDDVRTLQRDIARSADAGGEATIPQGTEVQVQIDEPLSSRTARVEDRVSATVAYPVTEGGRIVVPAGTRVEGTVERAQRASRPARGGQVDVSFDRLVMDDGRSLPLSSRIVSIDRERRFDKRNAGIGAAIGGVLGAVLGGTKAAIAGILIGGAGGGFVGDAGRDVELPQGALLTLRLDRPLATGDWNAR